MNAIHQPSQTEPARAILSFVGKQAVARKSSMVFAPDLNERTWEKIGSGLRELTNSSAWWLADWLIFGESTYGWRRYLEAIERTGLDYQTLRNYAWVARRFEHHRRRDALSFAHHAEVTRLSPAEQDYWLRKAETERWSRNELRRALRASLSEQREIPGRQRSISTAHKPSDDVSRPGTAGSAAAGADPGGTSAPRTTAPPTNRVSADDCSSATLTIEVPPARASRYAEQAAAQGLSVEEWAVRVLDEAQRRSA
ncbi:LmbU family transcriptional regulator [Pseudonocardia sp. ICBG1122]|nr:LmbU family transcriptional regulator [Pseudonocardia sp. AL041005-10]ALE77157.1 regulator [Pseudonocardia sp. AL041005-10]NWJ72094.1 LmbU family transcriptional regulator [Pseudonocardia pini]